MTAADHIELDLGPRTREAERLCLATRRVHPVSELIRFVVDPNGELVPDLKRTLPGRGVWVTARRDVLADAIKRKLFGRGLKREVRLPEDLLDRTDRLLERSALDALAIAGKAGYVVSGFAKVENALLHEEVIALLHAAEAAANGVKKLDAALRRSASGRLALIFRRLAGSQLDLALARPNVVHAALLAGPASDTSVTRLRRLERFGTGDPRPDRDADTGTGTGIHAGKAVSH